MIALRGLATSGSGGKHACMEHVYKAQLTLTVPAHFLPQHSFQRKIGGELSPCPFGRG